MNNINEKKVNYNSVCGIRRLFNLSCRNCIYFDKCTHKKILAVVNKTPEKRVLLRKNNE